MPRDLGVEEDRVSQKERSTRGDEREDMQISLKWLLMHARYTLPVR